MWKAFESIGSGMWENADDVLVSVILIIIGNVIASLIYYFTKEFLKTGVLFAQIIKITFQIFIIVICVVQIIGQDVVSHFTGGISIGLGYALQPYIISIFNGLMVHNDHEVVPRKTRISLPSEGITNAYVESIGLFNTVLKENGDTIIISNSSLTRGALRILHAKNNPSVLKKIHVKQSHDDDSHEKQHRFLEAVEGAKIL
jgi:hypothetical protein